MSSEYNWIESNFYLPESIRDSLEKYFVLHWTGIYTVQNIETNEGKICREENGIKFLYIPRISSMYSHIAYSQIGTYRNVAISFRKEFGKEIGHAVIKPLYSET